MLSPDRKLTGVGSTQRVQEAMGKGMQKRLNMRIFKKVTETNE